MLFLDKPSLKTRVKKIGDNYLFLIKLNQGITLEQGNDVSNIKAFYQISEPAIIAAKLN